MAAATAAAAALDIYLVLLWHLSARTWRTRALLGDRVVCGLRAFVAIVRLLRADFAGAVLVC